MKALTPVLACLVAALPAAALAGPHNGDRGNGSGYHGGAGSSYHSAPSRSYQPAPRYQPQAPRYQPQAPRYQPQAPRYQPQAPHYQQGQQQWQHFGGGRNVQPMPRYQARPAPRADYGNNGNWNHQNWSNGGGAYYGGRGYGGRIAYRGWNSNPWGWNGGRAWVAYPGYWGGGFWGSLAIGLSLNDYAVQQESPGADLLAQYGLQQTDCDQPGLVEIFGPDGSEVCAYPNDVVAPGEYQVDPSTLTLVSN